MGAAGNTTSPKYSETNEHCFCPLVRTLVVKSRAVQKLGVKIDRDGQLTRSATIATPRRWIPFGGSTADGGGGGGGAVGRPGATPRARPGPEQPLPAAIAPQRASAARAPASPGVADCC